jgi:hypothetical protein
MLLSSEFVAVFPSAGSQKVQNHSPEYLKEPVIPFNGLAGSLRLMTSAAPHPEQILRDDHLQIPIGIPTFMPLDRANHLDV